MLRCEAVVFAFWQGGDWWPSASTAALSIMECSVTLPVRKHRGRTLQN
jgi:hypothetical protein